MASYSEAYAALDDYRLALMNELHNEDQPAAARTFSGVGASAAFATPLNNVHATGVGLRMRRGRVVEGEFVIKVFVFEKMNLGLRTPRITGQEFNGVGVDVEHLPVQMALGKKRKKAKKKTTSRRGTKKRTTTTRPSDHQDRRRPVVGGIQISPLGAGYVGTLGCFVRRGSQLFALSNNHVLADTNALPLTTPIVQTFGVNPADIFAQLSDFQTISFATPGPGGPAPNRMDAAIAAVTDASLVSAGEMFGVPNYTPTAMSPLPGMRVTKSGRTTGVTTGWITATNVTGVDVNFGTIARPIITTFDNCVTIVGDSGSFSDSGDSGSAILNASTGQPLALLFAGDGSTTTASGLGEILSRFNVIPA